MFISLGMNTQTSNLEIEEIKVYTERLKKQYEELLALRRGIMAQIELDNSEAEVAKRNKEVILATNMDLIDEANKDLEIIKKEKDWFVQSLSVREADILAKQKLSQEFAEDLIIKAEQLETTKKHYEDLTEAVKNDKKKLEETIREAKEKNTEIESYEKEVRKIFELNKQDRERIAKGTEYLVQNTIVFEKNKEKFELEKEAVKKEKEQIERDKEFLKQDRLHLESQQKALKYAYDEAHRQLNEARRLRENKESEMDELIKNNSSMFDL